MKECDAIQNNLRLAMTDFNPRTLWKSATEWELKYSCNRLQFQSTHSMKECDHSIQCFQIQDSTFQSTHSMKECDHHSLALEAKRINFNPRTLWKSATLFEDGLKLLQKFQSTHSMKECDDFLTFCLDAVVISIHALYERVRRDKNGRYYAGYVISIHALYERVRPKKLNKN